MKNELNDEYSKKDIEERELRKAKFEELKKLYL